MDVYTQLLSNEDKLLAAQAYYNRGIITLKQAASMQDGDPKKIPLIGLAKQDFRHALAIEPKMWNARYNLEAALNLVPELPIDDDPFEKNEISSSRSIEAVGFRVDLP
jgi:mxaK protein